MFKEKVEVNYNLYRSNEIDVNYYNFADGNSKWIYLGNVEFRSDDIGLKDTVNRYKTCKFSYCITLEKDELSHCSRSTNAWKIQGFERRREDYLIIEDGEDMGNKILNYINNTDYMTACKFCNGTKNSTSVIAGEQI